MEGPGYKCSEGGGLGGRRGSWEGASAWRCGTKRRAERAVARGAEGMCGCGPAGVEVGARDPSVWSRCGVQRSGALEVWTRRTTLLFLAVWQRVVQRRWPNGGIMESGQRCRRRNGMGDLRNKLGVKKHGWFGVTIRELKKVSESRKGTNKKN